MVTDLPDPHPGPGEVRISVRAAGVNPSDWKKRKGLMDGDLPQTLGHEAAGVVDELGDGGADVAGGARVFGRLALSRLWIVVTKQLQQAGMALNPARGARG